MKRFRRSGLSLLELLAVVVILGVIAMIVVPRIGASSMTAKEHACFQNKAEINAAVERYYFENGQLPDSIKDLAGGSQLSTGQRVAVVGPGIPVTSSYFPDGIPTCPVSGNEYRLDPVTKRVSGHTAGSHE